ncbi:MAG: oxidoreductase [Candidatus Saccharibacteria bacterium]|nr:oxidoreductase [Candidatus Saccharibacteria bacterium]
MNYIDDFLNKITMYRLLLYVLLGIVMGAMALSAVGRLQYNPLAIAFSAGYITLICWLANKIFARVFQAPVANESVFLTALILALIITPYHTRSDLMFMTAAAGLAIASKFILAIRKKHIFNPAAVAVALTSAGAAQSASWWVGTSALLPFVIIGGLLIMRKVQRESMTLTFFAAVAASTILLNIHSGHVGTALTRTILHSSLFFLGFIMLTEPLTSPVTKNMRLWYAVLVGALFAPQIHIGHVYSTPELALLAGNVFAYIVSPKYKLLPRLQAKLRLAPDIFDFIFTPNQKLAYKPGQYMEWTLPHPGADSRGNRRYLTLASSPTEDSLRLGVKFYPKGSTYKKALLAMSSDTPIAAGQLGGDFVLPDDPATKLVFIAGGIGITPFRSMVKYLLDTNQPRDVVLMYSEKTQAEFVYTDVFNQAAQQLGLKTVYTLTNTDTIPPDWRGSTGFVSAEMIRTQVPDFSERVYYISGSHALVSAVQDYLHSLGVASSHIKTDFFPGYA